MSRFRLTLEYDGAPFVGWQQQHNGPSVQDALEDAIFKLSSERVSVTGAGRTDAGVHALGQVAHFDLVRPFESGEVRAALNHHLRPAPIAVLECNVVPENFHARFSAIRRHYLYRIVCRRAPLALERGRAWHVVHALDERAMHDAAQVLVGEHDFTTFRAAECQARSPVKTLEHLFVSRAGDEIRIEAAARSFLHHQVRSMVGSLKLVGEGKWTAGRIADALEARDRSRCGPVAPPGGLYLVRVDYGDGSA